MVGVLLICSWILLGLYGWMDGWVHVVDLVMSAYGNRRG